MHGQQQVLLEVRELLVAHQVVGWDGYNPMAYVLGWMMFVKMEGTSPEHVPKQMRPLSRALQVAC